MKSVPAALSNAIRTSHVLYAKPRLIADWNMNRYKRPVANNVPDDEEYGYDPEMFPIESIVDPIRPTKGILKARIGESTIGDNYATDNQPRFYISDPEDNYKYWTSPNESDGTGAITNVEPYVVYGENCEVNKIVIKLENTWASPNSFTVQLQYADGGAWSTIATSPTIRNDGQIILYYNGVGWSSNKPANLTSLRSIRGVKLKVNSLKGGTTRSGQTTTYRKHNFEGTGFTEYATDGKNSFFSLISIEAHREVDLTDRLISTEDTFDMAETSTLYPVGTITTNTAQVVLSNIDGHFNRDNEASPYDNDLLQPNVEFNLEYVYTVNGQEYSVQQFKMYGDGFKGQKDDTTTVGLMDASKFLQKTTPRAAMYEGLTVPAIIWRVLDSVGFVDYQIDHDDRVVEHIIPVFWIDGTETVWEVLDELAKATQTAIYFDGYGVLQVKTRDSAYDTAKSPAWTLRAEPSGSELPDIVSLQENDEFDANHFTITYQTTKWSDWNNGQPSLQKVWEPEGTTVLRASPLRTTLEQGDPYIWIPADDVIHWQYSGMVNIEGEIISYDGKHYVYYTGMNAAQRNTKIVKSADEFEQTEALTPEGYRHKNHFTGALAIKERGVWNSEPKRHPVDAEGYSVRAIFNDTGSSNPIDLGFSHTRSESKITLNPASRFDSYKDILYVTRGSVWDSGFYYYGTKFNFVKEAGQTEQIAGMYFHANGGREDGYYVEFRPTDLIEKDGHRQLRNELLLYSRKNGVHYRIDGDKLGTPLAIAEGVEYEVDVYVSDDHYIDVWVNGRKMIQGVVPTAYRNAKNGKFGFFAKGQTKVQFEYLYAIARKEDQPEDDFSFFDTVDGAFKGGQWDREWVYRWRENGRRKRKRSGRERSRWNQQFMDEFGPYVHEVREYDVKFEPAPVLHSRLYMTNDWNAICTEYKSSAFGARFVVANAGRQNAVVHGEDSIRYADQSRVTNQVMTALGRALVFSENATHVVKNDDAIQKRGKVESELNSKWIQNERMAEDIGDWMSKHWGDGSTEITIEVFGNPLIEVGDVVAVNYPAKSMYAATHRYFVTGVSNSFESGISTSLTLRRVV